jgi:hypothetical protein
MAAANTNPTATEVKNAGWQGVLLFVENSCLALLFVLSIKKDRGYGIVASSSTSFAASQ